MSLLVQYQANGGTNWTTLTARAPSVDAPDTLVETPVILHIYGRNTDASGRSKPERPARL